MAGLRQTTARLVRQRRQWQESLSPDTSRVAGRVIRDLQETEDFGPNPGNLRMLTYRPDDLPAAAPLVVILHGCSQNAASLDAAAGWSALAEHFGFAVLLPEQRAANNCNGCFNWFLPGDARRGRGEAGSIRSMIQRMAETDNLDRDRISVAGFSAGGAMAAVLLATSPEVFSAGAIIAGLPYGSAANAQQAFDGMFQGKSRPAREWAYLVRRASSHKGPWPRVSIWHGSADAMVKPMNAGELIKQWTEIHGLPLYPTEAEVSGRHQHRVWRGSDGVPLIELHSITGMGHGIPIASDGAEETGGAAGPFALDVGISSSYRIATFWGLARSPQEMLASNSQTTPAGAKVRRTLPLGS